MKPTTATYDFDYTFDGAEYRHWVKLTIDYEDGTFGFDNVIEPDMRNIPYTKAMLSTALSAIEFAEAELAKRGEPAPIAQEHAPQPEPLFTSHDGKPIFEGDSVWWVNKDTLLSGRVHWPESPYKFQCNRMHYFYFSAKEKADEYILRNTVCLSLEDLLGAWGDTDRELAATAPLFKRFENVAKERLGKGETKSEFRHIQELNIERKHFDNTGKPSEPPHPHAQPDWEVNRDFAAQAPILPTNAALMASKFIQDNGYSHIGNPLAYLLARLLNDVCMVVSKELIEDYLPKGMDATPKNLDDIKNFATPSGKSLI